MKMKRSMSRKIFEAVNVTFMIMLSFLCLYPILNQVALSFSSASGILEGGVALLPNDFTTETYEAILAEKFFWYSYKNTIIYTVVGTSISVVMTTLCAYPLSKSRLYGRNVILKAIVFTMFFGGGIVPVYTLVNNLGMRDTVWSIVIPGAIAPYSVLLMKTFFEGVPTELEDAATIDGLGQCGCFMRIILPLSKPIVATITLFSAVGYWNEWFSAMLYLNEYGKYPITLYLRNIMPGIILSPQIAGEADLVEKVLILPQSTQATCMLVTILPILCIYPFIQKYFSKGVLIGSIKI